MAVAAIVKKSKGHYISATKRPFWHCNASGPSRLHRTKKFENFKNPRWRRPPSLKNRKNAVSQKPPQIRNIAH